MSSKISLLVLVLCALAIAIIMTGPTLFSVSPRAQDVIDVPYCPMDVRIFVNEIFEDGHEELLNMSIHPDSPPSRWGFADDFHLADTFIGFNGQPYAEYLSSSSELSFVQLPAQDSVYSQGEAASIQLFYDRDKFDLIKKEIRTCGTSSSSRWLCSDSNIDSMIHSISGIKLQCGMVLDAGWTVQRKDSLTGAGVQEVSTQSLCDLNADGACNTFDLFLVLDQYGRTGESLTGDVNGDGEVNSLDYSIVAQN